MGPVALILHYIANILKKPRISGKIFLAFFGLEITTILTAISSHVRRVRSGGHYLLVRLVVVEFSHRTD